MLESNARSAVSVIFTVLNEVGQLDRLLHSLAAQTRSPDEIVVVDGGSSDGTWEALQVWAARADEPPVTARYLPGANISQGRNAAIRLAHGEVVAVTDAGVRLEPDWLERLIEPFEPFNGPDRPDVVSGFFRADPTSLFELALGATTLPLAEEIDPTSFLPSSRSVAFRREAWARIGGYPEWLDYCEDLVFDFALRRAGCRFVWAPAAVAHFRPRGNVRQFFRQYFRYARGDGKALLWSRRHLIRYAAYLATLVLLGQSATRPLALGMALLGGLAYCRRPFRRLRSGLEGRARGDKLAALMLIPLLRLVGDVGKMLGYPVGLVWRVRHRAELACRSERGSATLQPPERRPGTTDP